MRYGFARDMLALGVATDTVKKLLHHIPTSIDAVRIIFILLCTLFCNYITELFTCKSVDTTKVISQTLTL